MPDMDRADIVRTADGYAGPVSWIEGGRTHAGGAPPIVFLHGIGSDSILWQAQIDAMQPHRRAIAWNAPGYGQSAPLPMAATISADTYADSLIGLLDRLDVECCDMVGHSLGALMAARAALRHPHRIRRLVLSAPARGYRLAPDAPLLPKLQERIKQLEERGPEGMGRLRAPRTLSPDAMPAQVDGAARSMGRVSVAGYRSAVQLLATGNLQHDLAQLSPRIVPLISGQRDAIVPLPLVEELARQFPFCPLQVIEKAGHSSYYEYPRAFHAALQACLAG